MASPLPHLTDFFAESMGIGSGATSFRSARIMISLMSLLAILPLSLLKPKPLNKVKPLNLKEFRGFSLSWMCHFSSKLFDERGTAAES